MADYDIRRELLEGLEYQRASVRSIVGGLSEEAWHTPVVPSGWTVAGMVEHLGNAEQHWFQEVVAGEYPDLLHLRSSVCRGARLLPGAV